MDGKKNTSSIQGHSIDCVLVSTRLLSSSTSRQAKGVSEVSDQKEEEGPFTTIEIEDDDKRGDGVHINPSDNHWERKKGLE